jgi:hypothetical protein
MAQAAAIEQARVGRVRESADDAEKADTAPIGYPARP